MVIMTKKGTILIADDKDIGRDILACVLKSDYDIVTAYDGKEAIERINENSDNLSIIILDIIMPVVDGFGVLDYMHSRGLMTKIPVIMVTGALSSDISLKCYSRGVFDIITKPYDINIVKQRVNNAVELFLHKNKMEELLKQQTEKLEHQAAKLRKTVKELRVSEERFKMASIHSSSIIFEFDVNAQNNLILDGVGQFKSREMEHCTFENMLSLVHPDEYKHIRKMFSRILAGSKEEKSDVRMKSIGSHYDYNWFSVTLSPVKSHDGELIKILGSLRDINTQYLETADLRNKAELDMMTGIFNRATCEAKIRSKLSHLKKGKRAAFLIFDIDSFKQVNDHYGHNVGDKVIIITAHLIQAWFSHSDIVGRLGGDEFVVYMENVPNEKLLLKKFNNLISSLAENAEEDDSFPYLTVSAGACIIDSPASFEQIYKEADIALYEAKADGKGKFKLFRQ